jgi:hypothetical protein
VDDVLLLPRQAVFERDGKPIVYERVSAGFESREVKVLHRTESRVAIDGAPEGLEVALVSPDGVPAAGTATSAAAPVPGAGR